MLVGGSGDLFWKWRRIKKIPLLLFLMIAVIAVTPSLRSDRMSELEAIYFVPGDPPFIAITFETLWSSRNLETILESLDGRDVRATFFISGSWLKNNLPASRRILEAGHDIGNHTATQRNLLHGCSDELEAEIGGFNDLAGELLEYKPELFRPPLGLYNGEVLQAAAKGRCRTVLWSVESYDTISDSSEEIVDRVLAGARGGSIINFRVGAPGLTGALPEIIDGLRAMGYEPVSVSELLHTMP